MKRRLMLLLGAIILLVGGGIAYASIPGPDGVIHACYKTSHPGEGALIAIDSVASCPSGFTALNWNQIGPQGPIGPAGPGLSGIHQVNSAPVNVPLGTVATADVQCPPGEFAISGGWSFDAVGPHTRGVPVMSRPAWFSAPLDGPPVGWQVRIWNNPNTEQPGDTTMAVLVLCASVT